MHINIRIITFYTNDVRSPKKRETESNKLIVVNCVTDSIRKKNQHDSCFVQFRLVKWIIANLLIAVLNLNWIKRCNLPLTTFWTYYCTVTKKFRKLIVSIRSINITYRSNLLLRYFALDHIEQLYGHLLCNSVWSWNEFKKNIDNADSIDRKLFYSFQTNKEKYSKNGKRK